MKIEIEITEQEIKDLKLIRNYFGEHDKTPFEHLAYSELDKLVKKLQQADVIKSVCVHCGKGKEMHTVYSAMCLDGLNHFEQTVL